MRLQESLIKICFTKLVTEKFVANFSNSADSYVKLLVKFVGSCATFVQEKVYTILTSLNS